MAPLRSTFWNVFITSGETCGTSYVERTMRARDPHMWVCLEIRGLGHSQLPDLRNRLLAPGCSFHADGCRLRIGTDRQRRLDPLDGAQPGRYFHGNGLVDRLA